ncbi:hypothetical protein [Marivita sp. S2033]|uniref:hypothetical protein n=1 Tax=Marivita sp. S2033 TaxID=3373187 RepID=UPI003982D43A
MPQQNSGISCERKSWIIASGIGLVVFILALVIDWGFFGALLAGLVALGVAGILLVRMLCNDAAEGTSATDTPNAERASAGPSKVTPPSAAAAAAATSSTAPVERFSSEPVASSAVERESPSEKAPETADALPDVHTASATADAEAGEQVAPATPLVKDDAAKQDELSPPKAKVTPSRTAKTSDPAPQAETPVDYDGDGVQEGTSEGKKPETLTEARDGGPDNLKEIKGVGPKLEQLLHSMGFYHFDQIANWSAEEEAWVNANLAGFKGRVSRDNWVEQAKILASGGDTDFSKRVDKGGVY